MNFVTFFRKSTITETMRIFLTDDHEILLDGLKKIIAEDEALEVVGSASGNTGSADPTSCRFADYGLQLA